MISIRFIVIMTILLSSAQNGAVADTKIIGFGYPIAAFDPHGVQGYDLQQIYSNVYETLFFRGRKYEMVPAIGRDIEVRDSTVYIRIEENAFFSNQEALTAHDVVSSLNRALINKNSAYFRSSLESLSFKIIDDYTFSVTGFDNYIDAINIIITIPIIEKEFGEIEINKAPFDQFVGSGPYIIVENSPNERLSLARSEYYWGDPKIELADQVIVRQILDESQRFIALKVGDIDAFYPPISDSTGFSDFRSEFPTVLSDEKNGNTWHFTPWTWRDESEPFLRGIDISPVLAGVKETCGTECPKTCGDNCTTDNKGNKCCNVASMPAPLSFIDSILVH